MSQDDQELTMESAIDEIELLRIRHGVLGGSYRFLRSHTSTKSWIRFALFVTAFYALYTGLQSVPLVGPYGLSVATLGPVEAAVWTLFTAAVMWATYRGLDNVLS